MSVSWLRRPRVLLGLGVNAAYLLFYALGAASEAGLPRRALDAVRPAHREPTFYRRAPRAESAKVVSYEGFGAGLMSVYPAQDLLLVGEPGRQLLLSPILEVKGPPPDVPATVLLRFYSISRHQEYFADRRVALKADGAEVAPGSRVSYAVNTSGDGTVVENLSTEIPYGYFTRALDARVLTITVGREEVELSPLQLEALRNMRRCVQEGRCR